jgi:DNA-binding transcriptional LysR family regulator
MANTTQQWESRIGRQLKLRDLHVLFAVVQWGSMAKAAKHLAMSQPAVSKVIADLEHALRVRLLDRSSRGIEATIYAHALLKRSHVAFDELSQAIRDMEFLANPAAGEVRIASQELFAAGLLPAVIDQVSRRYPKIIVRVVQTTTATLEFRELRERKVDLVLGRIPGAFVADDLDIEILFEISKSWS